VLVVIGGGQVGCYHTRQLLKALRAGRLPGERLLVVDRNDRCPAFVEFAGAAEVALERGEWSDFLEGWMPQASTHDHLVPTPWAPHLLCEWLAKDLGAEIVEPPRGWRLPYEVAVGNTVYLSAAAWSCPATCVEPAHCPALHAPRDWDLGDLIEAEAQARGYRPAIFRLRHLGGGVAGISLRDVRALRAPLGRIAQGRGLVATSSRCHAAVNAIQIFTFAP
jgi:hypothetical protein